MELGERMAAVETRADLAEKELDRMRDNQDRVWTAMGANDQRLASVVSTVEGLAGTVHLTAQNAASIAIEAFRTEQLKAGRGFGMPLSDVVKLLGFVVVLAGLAVGVKLGFPSY